DLVTKLRYINPSLYSLAKKVLETNKAERHLRGGEATKRKYKNI
ncbi:MAG: sporulation transcriptional regulator SpoIIID, partial [Clostridia bacterium]|nr:sporulation transcriptional regulator SpoIIID [Clostridia bacterium]